MYRFVDILFLEVLLTLEMNYCKIEKMQTLFISNGYTIVNCKDIKR